MESVGLLSGDGSTKDVTEIPDIISEACSIANGDNVFITGGVEGPRKTRKYSWNISTPQPFPDLNQGKWQHGCSSYINRDGNLVLVVAGGAGPYGITVKSSEQLVVKTDGTFTHNCLSSQRNHIGQQPVDDWW